MYGTRLYFVPSTHLQLLLQVAQPHEVPCLLRARDLVSDEPYFLQSLRHTVSAWKVTLSHGRPDAPLNPGNARDGDSGERTSAEYSRRFNLARLMADEMAGGVVSSFICTMYRMSGIPRLRALLTHRRRAAISRFCCTVCRGRLRYSICMACTTRQQLAMHSRIDRHEASASTNIQLVANLSNLLSISGFRHALAANKHQ